MAAIPESTKDSLQSRLSVLVRTRWPQLATVAVRFRGRFAYVTGVTVDGEQVPLCRLRYTGYASEWGFALYRASHDDFDDTFFPDGGTTGTPEEALGVACQLYLGAPDGAPEAP